VDIKFSNIKKIDNRYWMMFYALSNHAAKQNKVITQCPWECPFKNECWPDEREIGKGSRPRKICAEVADFINREFFEGRLG